MAPRAGALPATLLSLCLILSHCRHGHARPPAQAGPAASCVMMHRPCACAAAGEAARSLVEIQALGMPPPHGNLRVLVMVGRMASGQFLAHARGSLLGSAPCQVLHLAAYQPSSRAPSFRAFFFNFRPRNCRVFRQRFSVERVWCCGQGSSPPTDTSQRG